MSRISFCLMMENPPLGHKMVCSTVKEDPHLQWKGMLEGVQRYLSARASLNAPLSRQKPNSSMGKEVSQFEAHFSLDSSMDFLPGARNLFFSTPADFEAHSCHCCWTACLAVIWTSKHSRVFMSLFQNLPHMGSAYQHGGSILHV